MAKSVILTDEAYERLEACKRDGESFSDVVIRLTGGRPLLDIAGTGTPGENIETAVENVRENLNEGRNRFDSDYDAPEPGG